MQNKIKMFGLLFGLFAFAMVPNAYALDDDLSEETEVQFVESDEVFDDESDDVVLDNGSDDGYDESSDAADDLSAMAVANYDVNGTVFQQITDLEQEKVLMELEKERAQLDLDLDRLAAEKIKLQMEMDTLSGRAEQEQQILQNEKARLEAEAAKIEQEKKAIAAMAESDVSDNGFGAWSNAQNKKTGQKKQVAENSDEMEDISTMYKLVNVMGAGNQLQATLSDLETGQTKRVSVGKTISGFTVKSISLEDGVVFSKDGETQNLNITSR